MAAATHDRPQASAASLLLEEPEPTHLSATALDLDWEPPAEPEVSDTDVTTVENLVNSARPCPAPPAGAQSALQQEAGQSSAVLAPLEPAEQLLPRQALTYVSGYVAAKWLAIDPTLGQATFEASTELGDERYGWIPALSRGGLIAPSLRWLREVEELEVLFCAMHGPDIDRSPGVVPRLTEHAALKFAEHDRRVLRKYAMTRTQLRLRELQRRFANKRRQDVGTPRSRSAKRARFYLPPK